MKEGRAAPRVRLTTYVYITSMSIIESGKFDSLEGVLDCWWLNLAEMSKWRCARSNILRTNNGGEWWRLRLELV
jgi:hypothetical protein